MTDAAYLTPPEAAELLRVNSGKVLTLIRTGELVASNIATRTTGRPRWRIARTDLDDFLRRRQPRPVTPPPVRRRRQSTGEIIKFF